MRYHDFAWTVMDAIEKKQILLVPGLQPFRPSQVVIPDHVWNDDRLNWETLLGNATNNSLRKAEPGEIASNLIMIVSADVPGRSAMVDPEPFFAVETQSPV